MSKEEINILYNINDRNNKMRKASCNLAEAAIRVIRDYDGVHRLSLAVSEWAKVISDETKINENELPTKSKT